MPPHIVEDLRDHLAGFVADDPEAPLFCAPHACHYSDRIHDLRHTHTTTAAKVTSQSALQARMGRSTASSSARYQHAVRGEDKAVAHALSALVATMDADSVTG